MDTRQASAAFRMHDELRTETCFDFSVFKREVSRSDAEKAKDAAIPGFRNERGQGINGAGKELFGKVRVVSLRPRYFYPENISMELRDLFDVSASKLANKIQGA